MKRIILILTLALLGGTATATAEEHREIRITHGPWLCDMDATGVTVMWKTDRPALSWVEVAPDDGKHFYSNAHPRHYDAEHGRRRALETLHRVRLEGLQPGTRYMYRIFSQATDGWSYSDYAHFGKTVSTSVYQQEPLRFTTLDPKADSVRFVVFNDIHGRAEDLRDLCRQVDFAACDFVVLNGDMRSTTESEEQLFEGWLDVCVECFASQVPILFVRGNHENRGAYADRLYDYFPHPSGRFYHTFKAARTEFVVLDCGEDKPDTDIEYGGIAEFDPYREREARWLSEALDSDSKRRIVFLHIPPATSTWHGDLHLQQTLLPILNRSSVDLMISGHTHRYALYRADDTVHFPRLVNDNRSGMRVVVGRDTVRVTIFGTENRRLSFGIDRK